MPFVDGSCILRIADRPLEGSCIPMHAGCNLAGRPWRWRHLAERGDYLCPYLYEYSKRLESSKLGPPAHDGAALERAAGRRGLAGWRAPRFPSTLAIRG